MAVFDATTLSTTWNNAMQLNQTSCLVVINKGEPKVVHFTNSWCCSASDTACGASYSSTTWLHMVLLLQALLHVVLLLAKSWTGVNTSSASFASYGACTMFKAISSWIHDIINLTKCKTTSPSIYLWQRQALIQQVMLHVLLHMVLIHQAVMNWCSDLY